MKFGHTESGFVLYEFNDIYNHPCELKESIAAIHGVWFGIKGNCMHLNVDQVKELLPKLQHFVEYGVLPKVEEQLQ